MHTRTHAHTTLNAEPALAASFFKVKIIYNLPSTRLASVPTHPSVSFLLWTFLPS